MGHILSLPSSPLPSFSLLSFFRPSFSIPDPTASLQSASQSHDKLPWPIAIGAHTRIIHRTEPQMPDINKWNEVVQCWNSRVEPLNLWTVYWEQFNIMRLPIFSANEFLETAVRVAQYESVTNEEVFRKTFREEITLRQAELESLFNKAWNQVLSNTDAAPIRKGNRPKRKRCVINNLSKYWC
jgi:hypothetical protein